MRAEIRQLICSYQNRNQNIWNLLRLAIIADTYRIIQAYRMKGIEDCDEAMMAEEEERRAIINKRNAEYLNDLMDVADNKVVEDYLVLFERDSYYTDPNRDTFDEIFQFRHTQRIMGVVRDREAIKN